MNFNAIHVIYHFEMARWWRTIGQSIASPVISTGLYFVVFGAAIGSRISQIDGIGYGSFIVPGLIMLSVMQESVSTHLSASISLNITAVSMRCSRRRWTRARS